MTNAAEIIEFFNMKPLDAEGGYFVETYRAAEKIDSEHLPERYDGSRNFSTAILYLLTDKCISKLHRLTSDEVFHFYLGDPVEMLHLLPGGTSKVIILGSDFTANQHLQVIVPKGIWQGARVKPPGQFALLGCTVAPGFEYTDLDIANRSALVAQYPEAKDMIDILV